MNLLELYRTIKENIKSGDIKKASELYREYKERKGKRIIILLEVVTSSPDKAAEAPAAETTENKEEVKEVKENNKMYAQLKEIVYISNNEPMLRTTEQRQRYKEFIENNRGKLVEIDTSYIFDNQYNTKDGFRIYDSQITRTINDIREGLHTCGYCGKQYRHDRKCNCDFIQREFNKNNTFFLSNTLDEYKVIDINLKSWKDNTIKSYELYNCGSNFYRLCNSRNKIEFIYNSKTLEIWSYNSIGYKKMTINQIKKDFNINQDIFIKALESILIEEFKQSGKKVITLEEYNKIHPDYKGIFYDFQGVNQELKGNRCICSLENGGTTLLIEGKDLLIIEK